MVASGALAISQFSFITIRLPNADSEGSFVIANISRVAGVYFPSGVGTNRNTAPR
jgi:hypothetical protein